MASTHNRPKVPRAEGKESRLPLAVGATLVIFLLWASLAHHLVQIRNGELDQARRDVANISIALAEQVSRLIAGTDQVMQLMQQDFTSTSDHFDFEGWMAKSTSFNAVASQVLLVDANGQSVVSKTRGRANPVNVADRDYFKYLSTHEDQGLLVGRSYAEDRISHTPAFVLSRRLVDAFGAFRGVLVVALDPDYIARQFKAIDVAANGSVALFGLDGYVRVRTPAVPGMYERNMLEADPALFKKLRQSPSGNDETESIHDGRKRIYGYKTLEGVPLVVAVGRSVDAILAPFGQVLIWTILSGIGQTAVFLAFLFLLLRELKRREAREIALAEANDALADAESCFRGVFESSLDALWIHRIHPEGAITVERLNPVAALSRNTDQSARGMAIEAVLPATICENARTRIAGVIASGGALRFQETDLLGAGSDCEVVILPLSETPHGRIDRVFVSIRDITHLRKAERAVAESEARYKMLAETTSDVITRLDLDFNRIYVSPACRRLFGYEPEELLGKRPSNAVHPDDAPAVRELARALLAGELPEERVTAVYRTRHKLGHWISVEAGMVVARDEKGAPETLVCSLRDVSARILADAAVKASETRFRLLAENTSELIMLGHDDGRRSYISPASQRLLGYTPDELAAMPLRSYVHPDDLADLYQTTAGLRGEASIVYRAMRKNHGWIWVEGQFRRIPDARDGEPTVIGTFRDVSERQAQAQALRDAKDAAEAAASLANQASQAKTDFLAAMSHEIRTPLNGILGYTDLLLDDGLIAGGHRRHLERIRNAGSALRTVVDDILDFSKIEAGRIDLEPLPFSLSALVDGAVSIVTGGLGSKSLTILTEVDREIPAYLVGDQDRLRQVLLNLLNNAVKFTPRGTVTLSVRRLAGSHDAKLRFTVTDTGIGIPEDRRGRLFERFSQVDGSVRRAYGGTGLGLAICRSLVEAMGGVIGVETARPQGSTFWFEVTLPIGSTYAAVDEPGGLEPSPYRAARILLAEDNEINQDLARAVIEGAGHTLDIVSNGADAIQAIRTNCYDLVLMDVQMPVMDGLSATRHIRGMDHPARNVPIVAMSANVLPAQIAEIKAAGMDDHVGKPFRHRTLRDAIALWASAPRASLLTAASDPIDREVLHTLVDSIGLDKVQAFSRKAFEELAVFIGRIEAGDELQAVGVQAHGYTAAFGTLGFSELAALLKDLEMTCAEGGSIAPLMASIRAAYVRAAEMPRATA